MERDIKIQCIGYLDPIEQAHPDKNKKIIGYNKILKLKKKCREQ